MNLVRNRSPRSVLALALAAAGLLLGGGLLLGADRLAGLGRPPSFHGTAWEPSETAFDFRLVDHAGREARLSDFRGEAVLLFFGYTRCPDVCPLTLNRLDRVLRDMGDDAAGVRVVLVTVDPGHDAPEVLAKYVSRFGVPVTGFTGDEAALEETRRRFYVYAEPAAPAPAPAAPAAHEGHEGHAPPPGADLNHTPQVFGIDRAGEIRVLLPLHLSDEAVADDVRALLRF